MQKMKCFLIILVYCATLVYTIENDIIYEKCSSEIRKEAVAVNKCIIQATDFDVTPLLFNAAKSIKANETTPEDFVAVYCPIFKKLYPCANLLTGGSKECKDEPRIVQYSTETNITTTLMLSMLDLVCGEDGATIVEQSVADDLLMYLSNKSEMFRDCMFLFEDRPVRYRNDIQKKLFLNAVTITTSCLRSYFKAERKYFLKDLVVRLGVQLNKNLRKSKF